MTERMKRNKKMRIKKLIASVMSFVLMITGISTTVFLTAQAKVPTETGSVGTVFFDASKAQTTFSNADDQYKNAIGMAGDYNLTINSSTDARITEDGVLQVDFEAVEGGTYDGSYTIWGIGGSNPGNGNCDTVTIPIKTTNPDVAKYIKMRFYNSGNNTFEINLADWMQSTRAADGSLVKDSSKTTTIPADGQFHDLVLQVPTNGPHANLQGLKMRFEDGSGTGTVYIKTIKFTQYGGGVYIFDDFSTTAARKNSLTDAEGALPFVRPSGTTGANIYNTQEWTMSTSDVNIVNNVSSGNENALMIKYQKTATHTTYANVKSSTTIKDEPLMAMTIKGADEIVALDNILNVSLYNGNTLVKKIPFTEFYEVSKFNSKEHTNISATEYKTYYTDELDNVEFDTVAFEIEGEDSYAGRIYVQDIYFPRYAYSVEYYYDNVKDDSKTEAELGAKYGEEITYDASKYTGKDRTGYKYVSASELTIDIENNIIRVDYEKDSFPYMVQYYYDGELDDSKTYIAEKALFGSFVEDYKDEVIEGYVFDKVEGTTITEVAANNIVKVYYEKGQYPYNIEYYYDDVKDDTKTVSDIMATYGDNITYDKDAYTGKDKTGYKYVGATSITIGVENNVIRVDYVRDSFPYKVQYYYDGVLDDSKTYTADEKKLYNTYVEEYEDKAIEGYVLDKVEGTTITENAANNIVKVYYERGKYTYDIEYYYDDVKDDSKTEADITATYGDIITYHEDDYTGKSKTGYKYVGATTISIGTGKNVIRVDYVKDIFPYTVEYYYAGKIDDSKTYVAVDKKLYGEFVDEYRDAVIDGYVFDKVEGITITEDAAKNVVKVYYKKGEYPYTIKYYYDNEIDDSKTVEEKATFEEEIGFKEEPREGYKLVTPSDAKIKITSNADNNVLEVHYVKDMFAYTVEYYYDGVLDETISLPKTALFGEEVGYEDKNITGYKLEKVDPESGKITIGTEGNVIKVYYVKDEFSYTIKYYYDGVIDEEKTVTDKALYQSEVEYTDKAIDGYVLDYVNPNEGKLTISSEESENIIDVYYKKGTFDYTVEYYYDGKLGDTEKNTAEFGSTILYVSEKEKYTFDKVEGALTVTSNSEDNVLKVYFNSIPEETTTVEETTTTEPETTTKATVSPKTGDSSNPKMMIVFALILMSTLVAVIIRRRNLLSE